ncbi:MAG: carbohydrate-binding protein [Enterocloster asparagiformis]|nr:carbohydrate-binding protein [Enterocloster asparagiformis]
MEAMIKVLDRDGAVRAQAQGEDQVVLVWKGEYEDGDRILFQVPEAGKFYVVRVDDAMDEAFVYMTREQLVYDIPFEEKKASYNPKVFTGDCHYLTLRGAQEHEIVSYRNLAKNVLDQHGDRGCYPHASANVETRGESVFAARNAIDGTVANDSHGVWPYESWGINMQDDAELTLDFGRAVDFDRIVLYTRADFPHDNWWEQVTFIFSDGTDETVKLEKSAAPHVISMKKSGITWLKLCRLIKADDPSPFPALTQIEVYGAEAK